MYFKKFGAQIFKILAWIFDTKIADNSDTKTTPELISHIEALNKCHGGRSGHGGA